MDKPSPAPAGLAPAGGVRVPEFHPKKYPLRVKQTLGGLIRLTPERNT